MSDTYAKELEALASEEGFRLPYPADMIAFFERHGYVVDLRTGEVCRSIIVELSPHAQALCHLYGVEDSDLEAIFAPVAEEGIEIEFDLFDYEGELEDYEEWSADQDYWRRGEW